uniref:Beta-catenin-like protein 1 n=1 Tax=Pipistrellus kuhlii TaxID=59472 RepID=A0A7J7X0V5_PIPKU|nr:hypothetical protein mPipKuh1_010803 [Pipistrellus kuhlii]
MESELDLYDILQEMHVVATRPDLYPLLVELNAVPSLLGLMRHDNTDVAITVVHLLEELTDVDAVHEGEEWGAEVLVQALADGHVVALLVHHLERLDPGTAEEREMMENLFDSLCSCLLLSANRERFLQGEGVQLMNLMLRAKRVSRSSALKVLDHAMLGPEGTGSCDMFVDILGLRTLFPLFMKSPRKIKKAGSTEKEHEEHVCSILASLLRNLTGQRRARLLGKFAENDSEKVDRLMELHFKYLDAVQEADKKMDAGKDYGVLRGEVLDSDAEEELSLRRLDAGLFVLQHICYVMAEICNAEAPQIRQRVHQTLNMRGSSIDVVRDIVKEYAESIGDGSSQEFKESEQQRILGLLVTL